MGGLPGAQLKLARVARTSVKNDQAPSLCNSQGLAWPSFGNVVDVARCAFVLGELFVPLQAVPLLGQG